MSVCQPGASACAPRAAPSALVRLRGPGGARACAMRMRKAVRNRSSATAAAGHVICLLYTSPSPRD
eukprot:3609756-Alexandrium_andersonii.AAC.1